MSGSRLDDLDRECRRRGWHMELVGPRGDGMSSSKKGSQRISELRVTDHNKAIRFRVATDLSRIGEAAEQLLPRVAEQPV